MKSNLLKVLYCVFIVLVIAFIVFLGVDFYFYNPISTSAPVYAYLIIRGLEFLLPAVIILIVCEILKRKLK